MIIGGRRALLLLFVGDLVSFVLALYLTLTLRYLMLPTGDTLAPYLAPFTFLLALWALVYYSAGLYSKRVGLFPSRLPDALLKTQIANIALAALLFFLVPAFGITPKTILVLYFIVSLAVIWVWRLVLYPRLTARRARERAVLVAQGREADELYHEVNGNTRYGVQFVAHLAAAGQDYEQRLAEHAPTLIVADEANAGATMLLPSVSRISADARRYQYVPFEELYEEVFDRIPLSELKDGWFLENITDADPFAYRLVKRIIDLIGGVAMGVITLIATPFVFIANLIWSRGPLFITQERLGRYGERVIAYKFRSMEKNLSASSEWLKEGAAENRVTKVGAFLRVTSLDEFPQFINVLLGDLSLVGPRNDILGLGKRLAEALPYYNVRYLVTPGITGWAQINQQYEPGNVSPQSIEENKTRLAYDFYYMKHRSLGLDLIIAVKTVKRMFFRMSSW